VAMRKRGNRVPASRGLARVVLEGDACPVSALPEPAKEAR